MTQLRTTLTELARLDRERARAERRIRKKPLELEADKVRVADKQKQFDAETAALAAVDKAIRAFEREIREKEEHKTRVEVQQNQSKNNKEYQALQVSIDTLAATIGEQETGLLEAFDEKETLETKLKGLKDKLEAAKQMLAESEVRIRQETGELESALAKLEAEHEEVFKQLGYEDRARYTKARERYGEGALVSLLNGTCQGCFVSIRPNDRIRVDAGTEIVACQHCGRLVYLD